MSYEPTTSSSTLFLQEEDLPFGLKLIDRWILKPYIINNAAVGFLPKHAGSRRERLMVSANEMMTQIFYVPPHKLHQFLEETSLHFGDSRYLNEHISHLLV